jgi:hypothetical protein
MPLRHAVVATPLAHLQSRPDHRSELKSQRAAGEVLTVLDRRGGWVRAAGFDGYPGWVRDWSLRFLDPADARAWAGAAQAFTRSHTVCVRETPGGRVIAALPFGARVRVEGRASGRPGWVTVELATGLKGVARADELGGLERRVERRGRFGRREQVGAQAAEIARRLAGATYLWGGTSSWGVDCSGLVQLAYALSGVALPRDAKDQIRVTRRLVAGERPAVGDLLFFGRNGDVNHVAMVTLPPRFVHAYGRVEEATFQAGRKNAEDQKWAGGASVRPELAGICLGVYRLPLAK